MSVTPNDFTFAGMLAKMISLPFGRSRWVSRYFVLLDSELRLYKDPHTETPSHILNLRQVSQVMPLTSTPQRPFCLQLGGEKPWIMDCGSEKCMQDWITAIQNRIAKHTSSSLPNTPVHKLSSPLPTRKTNSYCSIQQVPSPSPEVYRLPILPLRCTNLTVSDRSSKSESSSSLLSRRNKELTPLVIMDHTQQTLGCSSSTVASPVITTPSPTGAVIGTSYLIDDYYYSKASAYSKNEDELLSIENPSPTYLTYKERFRL